MILGMWLRFRPLEIVGARPPRFARANALFPEVSRLTYAFAPIFKSVFIYDPRV